MCGIAGIIDLNKNNSIEKETCTLDSMLERIRHRGPDEKGIFHQKDCMLGNVRLKIIGNSYGKQPLVKDAHGLVFNGEIYNYEDLAKTIDGIQNNISIFKSDTAVLFHYLNEHSLTAINKLNGMFAFCYVDKNAIYLVRDRFGQKPLFYVWKDNRIYFSSEMKAFITIVDFTLELSPMYASLETEISPNTIFKDIYQIEPGSYLKIDRKTKSVSTTYYYDLTNIPQKKVYKSRKKLQEHIRWLIKDAVAIRSKIDIDHSIYVSGGIDSSLISLLSPPGGLLFTYLPNHNKIPNEDKYVDMLKQQIAQAQIIKVEEEYDNFLSNFISMIYYNEGPTTTLAAYSQYLLAKTVQDYDIRVSLSGLGADEFLNGYVRHAIAYLPKSYYDRELFAPYKELITKGHNSHSNLPHTIFENLLNRHHLPNSMLSTIVNHIFKNSESVLAAMSICESMLTLPPLLHTDDHINMAFGIESRSPFMDYRLIELALQLPEHYKIYSNGQSGIITKYLLREAFKDILPYEIYSRKDKVGFTSNINGILRETMKDTFIQALELLQKEFPSNSYYFPHNHSLHEFSRWEYQILQLAITYLLFSKHYTINEAHDYFLQNYKYSHAFIT